MSRSAQKHVLLDMAVCLADFRWLYQENWCSAFLGPETKFLTIIFGSDLDYVSDEIIRHFFSDGSRWATSNCPRLRKIYISGGKFHPRCLLDLPEQVHTVVLSDVTMVRRIDSGDLSVSPTYSVHVNLVKLDMGELENRTETVENVMDENARKLTADEMVKLRDALNLLAGARYRTSVLGLLKR